MKYPICTLANILSPGKYCVVSTEKEHVSEVKDLEKNMKKEMKSEDTSEFNLSYQMCVAVTNSDGQLNRGIIEKKLKRDLYQVLLMDYGRTVLVSKSHIKVITNKKFIEVEPLAFIVRLYGLIPTKYIYVEGVRKSRACGDWSPKSQTFVENFFNGNKKVIVQNIVIEKRTVYGDLFVKPEPDMKFISLRKLLCKNEFCIYSESNFLKLEGLTSSNESLELKTKMDMVKKWQKENFGEGQDDNHSNSAKISNIDSCITNSSCFSNSDTNSFGDSSRQNNQTEEDINNLSDVSEQPIRLGGGRGKLKLLIAEMKNKKGLNVDGNDDCFLGSKPESASLGRGRFLRKYWEFKKFVNNNGEARIFQSTPASSDDSKNINSDCFSDAEKKHKSDYDYRILSRVERAMIRAGELVALDDSKEVTEVSAPTHNGSHPVARNATKQKEESEKSNQSSGTLEKEKYPRENQEENRTSNESKTHFDNLQVEDGWCFRKNTQVWKKPLGLIKTTSCIPYVLFDDTVVEPVKNFRDLPIQPGIIQNLEKKGAFRELSVLQQWAIPAIRKQHNTIIIGSAKTGKTFSYLVPVVDFVQDCTYFDEVVKLPPGNGPSVVIVASSKSVCEFVYYICHSLLGNVTKTAMNKSVIKIVLAHGNGCEKEVWVNLTNGCDILISTPHCLVRLLEMPVLTNFERLTCLVLDEIDVISQNPFRKSVRIILEKAKFATKDRHYQKILTGERWTPNVETLVKTYVSSYALIVGSFSEAVIFKKLKPSIVLVDEQHKLEKVASLLDGRIKKSKTLIVCESETEASRVNGFLTERGISSLLAHEKITADVLKEIQIIWKTCPESVLVATDGVLNELNLKEVQTLIHFELPSESKTNFYLRYSTLKCFTEKKENFTNVRAKNEDLKSESVILIDDQNHRQLPHIIDFVTRLGSKIPSTILRKCEEVRQMIEIEKIDIPICRNLLSFGRCRNFKNCPDRHALVKELDIPADLPSSGWVNFVILKIHDVSCLSVKLVEHVDPDGNTYKLNDREVEVLAEISKFFNNDENERLLGTAKNGSVCAVKSDTADGKVFHRAKIIEYVKVDKHGKPLEVKVKLLDKGDIWKRQTTELFELPNRLTNYSPIATDVWVVGVQPMDFDVSWSAVADDFVEKLMMRKLEKNQYWSGKIALALNNALFLDPIKRKEYLPLVNTHVFDLVVQDELLNRHIAVANREHLPTLLKLCAAADIEVPKKEERKKEDLAVVHPQWAFFDLDFIRVEFLAAENTSTIFLQSKKHKKVVLELEEDCQKEAQETKKSKSAAGTVAVGMFCLALFEDGKWNRGRIESENETQFYVFFIDHGDFLFVSKPDVIPISQTLLLRLPCQAIECCLVGIQPEDECPVEVLKEIYSFSDDGKDDLYACVVEKDLEPTITNGRKYKLNLLNKRGISLNKMLVDKGMVRVEDSEKNHLEDVQVEPSDDEEEESVEDEEEEEAQVFSDEYWKNHFNDDIFKDEEGLEFLKEFASKVFPSLSPFQNTPSLVKEVPKQEPRPPSLKNVDSANPEQEAAKERNGKELERKLELKSRDKVLTPQVLWCQNQLEIQIKILLGNVEDYSLECTVNNFSFRCFLREVFYAVDFKLFGSVNPQLTKVTLKAFHVLVVLTKLASPLWPRLHADKGKHRWINLDVESLVDKDGVFSDKIESAKMEIESGMVKKGIRCKEIRAYSDSENSDVVSADDSEDSQDLD